MTTLTAYFVHPTQSALFLVSGVTVTRVVFDAIGIEVFGRLLLAPLVLCAVGVWEGEGEGGGVSEMAKSGGPSALIATLDRADAPSA